MSRKLSFSLRTLLIAVVACSGMLAVGTQLGWIEAIGLAVCMGCLALASRARRWRGGRFVSILLVLMGAIVAWGVSVDYCTFWVGCPNCKLHWWTGEYRLWHRPLHITKSRIHQQRTSLILEDLGAPCQHQMQHDLINRWWGIWFHVHPDVGGICCFEDPEYSDESRERMREAGRRELSLGPEMRRRIQSESLEDYKAFHSIARQIIRGEASRETLPVGEHD